MLSPLQLYFANLKQQHQLNEIVVIEDRPVSTEPRRRIVMVSIDASDEAPREMAPQSVATDGKVAMNTHTNNTNPPSALPIRMKFVATTA